jgi:hypothetical protein
MSVFLPLFPVVLGSFSGGSIYCKTSIFSSVLTWKCIKYPLLSYLLVQVLNKMTQVCAIRNCWLYKLLLSIADSEFDDMVNWNITQGSGFYVVVK